MTEMERMLTEYPHLFFSAWRVGVDSESVLVEAIFMDPDGTPLWQHEWSDSMVVLGGGDKPDAKLAPDQEAELFSLIRDGSGVINTMQSFGEGSAHSISFDVYSLDGKRVYRGHLPTNAIWPSKVKTELGTATW